jgi:predicted SprT family Zn-dependent metalloprotease
MGDVVDGEQLKIFDPGEPVRRPPTREELESVLQQVVKLAVWKRHRGRPPRGMDWSDLYQQVSWGALERLKGFRHGGKFTLFQFAYVAACYALTDIHRENMKTRPEDEGQNFYPLFDDAS